MINFAVITICIYNAKNWHIPSAGKETSSRFWYSNRYHGHGRQGSRHYNCLYNGKLAASKVSVILFIHWLISMIINSDYTTLQLSKHSCDLSLGTSQNRFTKSLLVLSSTPLHFLVQHAHHIIMYNFKRFNEMSPTICSSETSSRKFSFTYLNIQTIWNLTVINWYLILLTEIGCTQWTGAHWWMQAWLVCKPNGIRETIPYHVDGGCSYSCSLGLHSYVHGGSYYWVS